MLLRRGPEDVPASSRLLQGMILLNLLTGIVVLSTRYDISMAVSSALLDLVLSLAFAGFLLVILNRRPRFVQTAIALCGVDTLFHLLLWPFLIVAQTTVQSLQNAIWILMLFMASWELLVMAHIFRHAIESRMSVAIALSFALFILSIAVSQLLFSGTQ